MCWEYPALVFMSSILLPLFHTLPTPSRKIPVPLPSPQLFLPSLREGMSFFLALVTHSYLYFSRVSINCQFCLMSLLCQKAAKSTQTSPIFAEDETKQLGYRRSCARTTNWQSSPSSQHGWSQSTLLSFISCPDKCSDTINFKSLGYCWYTS